MTTNYVKSWFARGDDDLTLVKLMLEQETISPNLACFHAQQAAEKYLKGFLAHHDLHVRKIHDLEVLLEDCKNVDSSFETLRDSARFLSRFYAKSRYPDDYVEFSREDAEKAFKAALRIKEFILSKINSLENKSGFGLVGLIIAVAAIGLLASGGLYFREGQQRKSQIQQGLEAERQAKELRDRIMNQQRQRLEEIGESPVAQQPSPSSSAPSGVEGWKTYRNEKYGFEVKYPTFGVSQQVKDRNNRPDAVDFIDFSYWSDSQQRFDDTFTIGVHENNKQLSFEEWFYFAIDVKHILKDLSAFRKTQLVNGNILYSKEGSPSEEFGEEYGPIPNLYLISSSRRTVLAIVPSHSGYEVPITQDSLRAILVSVRFSK